MKLYLTVGMSILMKRRLSQFKDFVLMPVPVAVGFLLGGLTVFFGGFLLTQPRLDLWAIIEQGYSNFGIELLSLAATVLVIDQLNQRRANQERLQELIIQMRSKDNHEALRAVEIVRLKNWLSSGKLRGVSLSKAELQTVQFTFADLKSADLYSANLSHADLSSAILEEADLGYTIMKGADLHLTNLRNSNLTLANLEGATLTETNLKGAHLGGAILTGAYLRDVEFDRTTVLPDESLWTPETDMSQFTNIEGFKIRTP